MKAEKLYGKPDDEIIYPAEHWVFLAGEDTGGFVDVELHAPDRGNPFRWCKAIGEHVERGNGDCGTHCNYYAPKNGRSGCCLHLTHTNIGTGQLYRIYGDGRIEKAEVEE